jgi:cytochrome c oxidase assembly factor CtaG
MVYCHQQQRHAVRRTRWLPVLLVIVAMMFGNGSVLAQHIQPAEDRCVQEPCVYDLTQRIFARSSFIVFSIIIIIDITNVI